MRASARAPSPEVTARTISAWIDDVALRAAVQLVELQLLARVDIEEGIDDVGEDGVAGGAGDHAMNAQSALVRRLGVRRGHGGRAREGRFEQRPGRRVQALGRHPRQHWLDQQPGLEKVAQALRIDRLTVRVGHDHRLHGRQT